MARLKQYVYVLFFCFFSCFFSLAHAQSSEASQYVQLKANLAREKAQLIQFHYQLQGQKLNRRGWTTIHLTTKLITTLGTLASVHVVFGDASLVSAPELEGVYDQKAISIVVSTAVIAASSVAVGSNANELFRSVRLRTVDIKILAASIIEKIASIEKAERLLVS